MNPNPSLALPMSATASVPAPPLAWPVGTVIPYAGPLAGSDAASAVLAQLRAILCAQGWLYCDGSAYPCADYWLLYGVIGFSFGGSGTSFRVPNLCGRFVRGVDGGAGNDPDAATRIASGQDGATGDHVGTLQADAFQGHEHLYVSTQDGPDTAEPAGTPLLVQWPDQATTSVVSDQTHGAPRVASETRPVNVALNYLIRYC